MIPQNILWWVHLTLLICFLTFTLPTSCLYYCRRKIEPIRSRNLGLILTAISFWTCGVINDQLGWVLSNTWTCRLKWILLSTTRLGFALIVVLRCLVLTFIYSLNRDAVVYATTDKSSWILNHRWIISRPALFLIILIGTLLHCLPAVVFFSLHPDVATSTLADGTCNVDTYVLKLFTGLYGIVYVALVVCTIRLLRSVKDNYFIKQELRELAMWGTLCIFDIVVARLVDKLAADWTHIAVFIEHEGAIVYGLIGFVFVYISVVKIVRKTYESKNEDSVVELELEELLQDSDKKDALRKFLISEFSVENLLFWEEVVAFREKQNIDVKQAIAIYDKYIAEESPLWVNLSAVVYQEIKNTILQNSAAIDRTIFQSAETEILNLIREDPFRRFKQRKRLSLP